MSQKLPFIVTLGIIIGLFTFSTFVQPKETKKREVKTEVLSNEKNQPLLATGNCFNDADCFPSGCNKEVCTNHKVQTSCSKIEAGLIDSYTCGCVENRCAWYK